MNRNRNSNPLLLEIMIAVLFLALCATAIMEVFGFVKNLNTISEIRSKAAVHVQNVGERLYVSSDAEALLESEGFEIKDDIWLKDCGTYTIRIRLTEETTLAGWIMNAQIEAVVGDEIVASIPSVRYYSEEVK